VALDDSFDLIGATLKKASAAMREAGVPFLLAGSLAAWARGGPETRHDLDFIVKPEDAERALDALCDAGMEPERPPEGWLLKAWDGEVLVDLIFGPSGIEVTDEVLARGDDLQVLGMTIPVMSLEDLLVTKLLSMKEHHLDYQGLLLISRAVREQVDWPMVRRRTSDSPYAKAFFTLVEELGVVSPDDTGKVEPFSPLQTAGRVQRPGGEATG
jgi:Uncharacterised nucleotidyltransferase